MDHPLSALTSTGVRSPLQTTYPESATGGALGEDSILDRYKSHAEKFSREVLKEGVTLPSTSHDIASGSDPLPVGGPEEWYGVGGARDYRKGPDNYRDATRPRVPERILQVNQFSQNDALRHILDVEDHNIARSRESIYAPAVFAGGWNEKAINKKGEEYRRVVLDHSLALPSKSTAMRIGRAENERAIFDAKNIQDISTKTGKPIP